MSRARWLIDDARLLDRVNALATFGATSTGGVNRPALGPADIAARRFLIEEAQSRGYEIWTDPLANLYAARPGRSQSGAVMTGSHVDSQPTGGRFDGAYGICAAWEVLAALDDSGIETEKPVVAVVWTNEEGCRFPPGSMGSAYFACPSRLPDLESSVDKDGIRVSEAIADVIASQGLEVRSPGFISDLQAFLELHIEQGPVLDEAGLELAVVSGIAGVKWFELTVHGRADHAGATPLDRRADALREAARIIGDVAQYAEQSGEQIRATVGSITVSPNVPNTVTEQATLSVDVRSLAQAELDRFEEWLRAWPENQASGVFRWDVALRMDKSVTHFDEAIIGEVTKTVADTVTTPLELPSWAFHDAMYLADRCPTGMLFVPSIGGVSHHPDERTDPEHLVRGAEALTRSILQLAGTPSIQRNKNER